MRVDVGQRWLAAHRLSAAARVVWAKHDRDDDGWLPLWRHMADSAAVAGVLWDQWLPARVREFVSAPLPEGERDGRRLVVWLAGVHDIGKVTPAFACQVEPLADRMRGAGLGMATQRQMGPDRRMARHGLAGQLLLQEWLEECHGWPGRATAQFGVVVGGHHGVPPDHAQIHDLETHPGFLWAEGPSEGRGVRCSGSCLMRVPRVPGWVRGWRTGAR
ncbi:CRISPR-associated endonuclease Cas3'' [Streptomyces sanyensis]|uniref:CRISPR-associated endonuclease Cas3'' n=1 Tax=Streptomyces sanyensis TaxID=568869 RepID=UPI003D76F2D7